MTITGKGYLLPTPLYYAHQKRPLVQEYPGLHDGSWNTKTLILKGIWPLCLKLSSEQDRQFVSNCLQNICSTRLIDKQSEAEIMNINWTPTLCQFLQDDPKSRRAMSQMCIGSFHLAMWSFSHLRTSCLEVTIFSPSPHLILYTDNLFLTTFVALFPSSAFVWFAL